jgi:hypothetical protein
MSIEAQGVRAIRLSDCSVLDRDFGFERYLMSYLSTASVAIREITMTFARRMIQGVSISKAIQWFRDRMK